MAFRLLIRSTRTCTRRGNSLISFQSLGTGHSCVLSTFKDTVLFDDHQRHKPGQGIISCRQLCTSEEYDNGQTVDKDGFKEIYKIPDKFLGVCRRIQFMKIMSLSVTTLSAGFTVFDPSTAVYASLLGLGSVSFAFTVMGRYVESLVCRLYLKEDTEQLKISTLNFMGRRKDFIEDIDNVTTDMNQTETKIYMSPNNKGKLLIHVGAFTRKGREEFDKYF